jgi:hypothetical protein
MHWPLSAAQTVTAAISIAALTGTLWLGFRNFAREALNQKLNAISLQREHFDAVRKWADQLSDTLTEAIHLCDLDPNRTDGESFFARRHRLLITLSSMIDRGRWFFPNIEADDHGADKELGYRGYRHEVLDGLVAAYRFVHRIDYRTRENNRSVRDDLTSAKRYFVGQVQKLLDPANRDEEFRETLKPIQKNAAA